MRELNSQMMELLEEDDIDGEIEEVDKYELDMEIGITTIESNIVSQFSSTKSALNPDAHEFTGTAFPLQQHSIQSHSNMSASASSSYYNKLLKTNLPTSDWKTV